MTTTRSGYAAPLAIAFIALGTLTALGQQSQTLWYRGYFDGQVTIRGGENPGYYYSQSRPTAYPLHEAELYSDYLPCRSCGLYHRQGAYVPQLGRICNGSGTHLDPDTVYTRAPDRLPGWYFYEKQNHYTYSIPNNVGWPWRKYDQATEPTGAIRMGRQWGTRTLRDR